MMLKVDGCGAEQRRYITELRWRVRVQKHGGHLPHGRAFHGEIQEDSATLPTPDNRGPQMESNATKIVIPISDESANDGTPEDATDRESVNEAHDACVLAGISPVPLGRCRR